MKYDLTAFFLSLSLLFLCASCRKESTPMQPQLPAADSLMNSRPDSSLALLRQISAPQKLEGADRALYALLMTQARYKNYLPLQSDSLIGIAAQYYKKKKDPVRLAKSRFYTGCVYAERQDLATAADYYLQAARMMPEGADDRFTAMVYSQLGDCYKDQDLHTDAKSMYRKAYQLSLKEDSVRACHCLKNIGDSFLQESRQDSAFYYYQQALQMSHHMQSPALLALIYKKMASLCSELEQYTEAESYITKAFPYLSDEEEYKETCYIKGNILDNLNQKDSAIYYWNIGKEANNIHVKTASYDNLYQANKDLQQAEKAILYIDSFITLYDSIQIMNDNTELHKLMDNHWLELHKQEVTIQNQRIIGTLIFLFMLTLLVLITIFFYRDRKLRKKNQALQQRLRENRAEEMLLTETEQPAPEIQNSDFYKLAQERLDLCVALFKETEGYKKLNELENATPKIRISLMPGYRFIILRDMRETFIDVMAGLKNKYPALTSDDMLYCTLSLLHYSKDIITEVIGPNSKAIKSRKNRIKDKIDPQLFQEVFDY